MKKSSILAVVGVVFTVFGGLLSFCWEDVFKYILAKELQLTPTSRSFTEWKDPTKPLVLDFFFFNWTNADSLLEEDYKPKFEEVGPYSFKEHFGKGNVTWNKNNTISYRRRRVWYFDPVKSVGTLDDVITTINPVPLSAAYVKRHSSFSMKLSLSWTNRATGQQVSVSKTAGEFLYSGISNELLTLAAKMPQLSDHLPGDKFGWFYQRNGSLDYEGNFNMDTGAEDISKIGKLREWNYKNRTDFYKAECGMINGSDGAFYSPGQTRNNSIEVFSSEICKTLKFDYLEDVDVDGIQGYRYVGSKKLLDSGELDANNLCNCNGECVPYGLLNISACRYGAPVFVSYPHFLHADPSYLRQVEGLLPNESRHRFYITVEPKTGIPIDAAARLQINLLLQPYDFVSIYNKVPRIFFPMIWFQETYSVSPENSEGIKLLLWLSENGLYFPIGLLCLGLTMIAIVIFMRFTRNPEEKDFQRQKSYELSESVIPVILETPAEENIIPIIDSKDPGNKVT